MRPSRLRNIEGSTRPRATTVTRQTTDPRHADPTVEALLREALALSQPILYRMNVASGVYDYLSDSVFAITGYSREEFRQRGWKGIESFIVPEDAARVLAQLESERAAASGGKLAGVVEYRFLTKSGDVHWMRDAYTQVLAEDGSLDAIVGCAWDITRERRAEAELHRQQALTDAILRNLPFEMWARDADGRIVLQSDVAVAMWGDLRGRVIDEHDLSPAVLADWRARTARALAGERVVSEARFVRDGVERILRGVLAPIVEGDRVIGVVGANLDMTDFERAAQEIRELNATLEARVAARTAELTASNRELEAFAYSVSHDLRAPLRALAGFSQILAEDHAASLDDKGLALLARIQAAAARMAQLIDDLLELSRVTRVRLATARVDLSALCRRIVAELAEAAPGRSVDVTIADGLDVEADPNLLRLAMENLLSNAWKFTGPVARASIEVGRGPGPDGADWLYVRDNGVGFDMRFVDKIFGAFQRLHAVDEFPGTGIGLATAQRIILRHGGAIRADASPGAGATLYFRLPAPVTPAPPSVR